MNKIQQIEEVVRKECPWLMELSFGCEVQVWNHDDDIGAENYEIFSNRIVTKSPFFYQTSQAVELQGWGTEQVGNLKIIGHPIQLSDILYTVEQFGETIIIRSDGEIWDLYNIKKWGIYNLTLPFKDQSEEVINFLHEIICKEK